MGEIISVHCPRTKIRESTLTVSFVYQGQTCSYINITMSLTVVFKRKLFYHSFYSKHQPYCVIYYQRDELISLEKCFIHRKTVFVPHQTGIRLLSISMNKFNIISRLTSYFLKEKPQVNKPVRNLPEDCPNASKDSESSSSLEEKGEQRKRENEEEIDKNSRNFLRKHKWISLLGKLPGASLYNISSPVNAQLKEDSSAKDDLRKTKSFQKQIHESTEMFLEKYNKDLDLILKKANPPSASKRKVRNNHKHTVNDSESAADMIKAVKYPTIKPKNRIPVKTENYEKALVYLQSLGIPCEDLEMYPNIQEMDKDTVLKCIDKLKEIGIHVVFSLFLIDRISIEHKLNKKESTLRRKVTKVPLTSFQQVKAYLGLCQLLEKPDLDIRNLLEQLGRMGHYCDMLYLHKKVKKLREVGATAKEIWSNLEILQGYDLFDDKIDLYMKSQLVGKGPFPVHLFLAKSMSSFREQLAVGSEIDVVALLLDVSVADIRGCWGFRRYNTEKLQYKVKMCLAAGISKIDIFNNLGELIKLPIEQCHAVTTCFRASGLPASVFVLREMVSAATLNGYGGDHGSKNKNVHSENTVQTCADICSAPLDEDWVGDSKMLCPEGIQVPTTENCFLGLKNGASSTKKHRRMVLELISHLLKLDRAMLTLVLESRMDVSSVLLLDVQKNLEYLISKDYTRDHIARCPLILAHPHRDLARVVSEVDSLVMLQLQSAVVPSSSSDSFSGLLSRSSLTFQAVVGGGGEALKVKHVEEIRMENPYVFRHNLLASPEQRLNAFQYFLEKEISFSLASVD